MLREMPERPQIILTTLSSHDYLSFMPRNLLLISLIGFCAVLSGCGSTSPVTANETFPGLTGNWQMQTSQPPAAGLPPSYPAFSGVVLVGSLVQSGSDVTGLLQFEDLRSGLLNGCVSFLTLVTISGTINASGAVELQGSVGGGTVKIAFSAPPAKTPFVTATMTVSGGSCALAATPSLAGLVPNVSGTYTGPVNVTNFVTNAVSTGTATLELGQLDTPNPTGHFAMSGTLTVTGTVCNGTATFNGEIGGLLFQLFDPDSSDGVNIANLSGTADPTIPDAGVLLGAAFNSTFPGSCNEEFVFGQLTPQ
jgi:hypothetical protein